MAKDVKQLMQSNENMVIETASWRHDISSMAMVQSCTAEYLSMQTAIDREQHRQSAHMQETTDALIEAVG